MTEIFFDCEVNPQNKHLIVGSIRNSTVSELCIITSVYTNRASDSHEAIQHATDGRRRCFYRPRPRTVVSCQNVSLHYENMPMQPIEIFFGCKNENFQLKNVDLFLIFAQNKDCGYILERPH